MKKVTLLQRAMVVNRSFSYATLQFHTDLSQSYIFGKIKTYEKDGFIERAGLGSSQEKKWRLTQEGKRQFDPNAPKESVIHTLYGGRNNPDKTIDRAEYRLWQAIKELKSFLQEELLELNLANETTTRQYLSLLNRAGILNAKQMNEKKNKRYEGRYKKRYTLTDKAGIEAPLMGRIFYVFDPNTGEYWATPMEKFEEKNRPGDAVTS
ncbi:MAG: hypothetical protein KKF12_12160 [Proteobacteria bacterium]|nr:hypothetical protein [Desulfobacula sp.]MBU3953975.1 hypothetical protein [Pseudomonadota bacterium]MBU4131566.1 hypothetical protein [Pseudomonadota bacterium]